MEDMMQQNICEVLINHKIISPGLEDMSQNYGLLEEQHNMIC